MTPVRIEDDDIRRAYTSAAQSLGSPARTLPVGASLGRKESRFMPSALAVGAGEAAAAGGQLSERDFERQVDAVSPQLAWLTYENVVRFDALARGVGLEALRATMIRGGV